VGGSDDEDIRAALGTHGGLPRRQAAGGAKLGAQAGIGEEGPAGREGRLGAVLALRHNHEEGGAPLAKPSSQDRSSLNGKILRVNPDGSVPSDNPFGSPVWSLGHRNVQGLSWDSSGRLWATEFGQDTKDEVNLIQKGNNYGWPNVEGDGDTQGGTYTNPLVTWSPSEASPSGDAVVGSTLYVGALRGQRLWQVPLNGASAILRKVWFRFSPAPA